MKEITRIHIAKISYDIEIPAKKELEGYIKKLELYADDAEILEDIEMRITELLAERGVEKDDIVASDDVQAIRKKLGEPEEFIDDASSAMGANVELGGESKRKFFRDTDDAFLGGVLSGIAQYLGIRSVWTRLIFIVLFFASAGTAFIVYIVLWIVMAPAKTAAEKLQMKGEAVTLDAIKQESAKSIEVGTPESVRPGVVVVRVVLGFGFLALAAGALLAVAVATVSIWTSPEWTTMLSNGWMLAAFCLAAVSGMLLAMLGGLAAYASFAWRLSKKIGISAAVITLLGLLTFSVAIGIGVTGARSERQAIEASMVTTHVALPDLAGTKKLVVDAQSTTVSYQVTNKQPYAVIVATKENNIADKVEAASSADGATLRVRDDADCHTYYRCADTRVVIYGPMLDEIQVENGGFDYASRKMQKLTLATSGYAGITVSDGIYEHVNITAKDTSSINVEGATVNNARVDMRGSSSVQLGNIKKLVVNQPVSCPIGQLAELTAESVTSGTMTYSDKSVNAESYTSACGVVKFSE